jgi:hypothetical protein
MEWLNQLTPQQRAVANKVAAEADRQGVPRELALAAAMQESKFNQKAKSKTGPVGVMQLGKAAANEQGVNRHNLDQNIKGGVGYLKQMLVQQNGDPQRALIAYHDGPSSPFFKGGSMSPEAYNHLQKVKSYGGFQGDVIPMATNTPTGVTIADIDPVPDIPLFTAGETVGRPRDARDVAAGVAGAGLGAKFGQNVMPSHREQQLMQAARRLDLLESKQAIDAANAAKVRTFGGDVANWHPGQYREDISRNIINPSSQADAAEQARQLEARAKAAQRFGQTVQAGPESRIQIPVEAGGGPRGGPPKTPMPTSVIPEAPVPPAAGEAKPFLRSARFPGGGALNVLGGAGAAAQLYDAYERYKEGDYPGAALGAISGVGGGVGTFFPNPVVQAIGGGVGLAGAGAQYLYDKYREDQEAKKQQAAKPNMAEGGLARLPKFAGRGESLVKVTEAAKKAIGFAPPAKAPAAWTFGHDAPGKMSDWAQNYIGQHIVPTQADRMGGVGGPSYSANQLGLPQYRGRAWGSGQQATASGIANLAKDPAFGGTSGQVFAPLLGSENMHQSNQIAFDKLLREFYRNKASLTPEKQAMINEFMRTGGGADRKTPLFDPIPDFDIANKRAVENLGQTFDTRKAIAEHAFGGTGMGKTKAQIFDYQGTLDKIRDPHTIGAPSFAVGPRAFRLTGDVEATPRPDLNLAYPYQLHGEDLGVTYTPVPSELSLMDFQRGWREHTGKKEPLKSGKLPQPGYYEHTLGYTPDGSSERIYPRQQITEEWIKELQRSGFAGGGIVNAMRKALTKSEREANLQKFLLPSQEKRVMYHGTQGDVNKFNPNNRITFLTPEPSFANSFASKSFDHLEGQSLGPNPVVKPGANVMPVHVQAENIFDPYNPAHQNALHDKLMEDYGRDLGSHDVRRLVYDASNKYDNWQGIENHMVQNAIKDLGHDAFISTENGVRNLGVYDPRRIKSAIGNEGTYNTRDLDVTKAEGGLVHLQSGGNPKLAALKTLGAPIVDRINMHFKDVTKRIPQLQDAAQRMQRGELSREEYEQLVNAYKPVTPFSFVPRPATREEAMNALAADKKDLFGVPSQTLQQGHPVGLRLDIPAYSNHGVWVPTVHEQASGFGAGKSIGHESVASVLNPQFGMSDKAALSIAAGKPKGTIATIKGGWNPISEQVAVENAQKYLNHPDWRQVGMDPERHGYFYDRASMDPVVSAEEALQIGPLVLARKPVYGKKEDFGFAEGGLTGLYANIHAKQERIKHGSGEKMRKPGTEGAPTAEAFRESAKTAKMKKGGQVSLSVGRGEKLPVDQGAGLTAKGRAKYNRETGSHLQAPQPEGGPRKDSFCARMQGVVDHAEGDAPRAKAALQRWKC